MRLADHFLAARGSLADIGGFATIMGPAIERAQRFEVADDVARAAGALLNSRPSSLVAALPLCRLPYETMWIEYRGGLLQEGAREFDGAKPPWKQGMLIESMPGGQTGFMTIAWMHKADESVGDLHPVNISPVSVYFDWREGGNVREVVRASHAMILQAIKDQPTLRLVDAYRQNLETKWMLEWTSDARISAVMTGRQGWHALAGSPREIEAMRVLDRHAVPGLSPAGVGLVATLLPCLRTPAEMSHMFLRWEADMQGEGGWVQCLLAMLNSRNPVVESLPVDVGKLNRARRKSGKPEFLPYSKTRLAMSRSQERIARAHGLDREAARQHLVRGHFKVRRTGVYWWSSFLRGDARRGDAPRPEYDVR